MVVRLASRRFNPALIRELREQRGYSDEDFARELGKHPQTLAGYEKGYSPPSVDTLARIAELLKVEPGSFFVEKLPRKAPLRSNKARPRELCAVDGCFRTVVARSLCRSHYYLSRKTTCVVEGCHRSVEGEARRCGPHRIAAQAGSK